MTVPGMRGPALGALAIGFGGTTAPDPLRRAVADGLGCVVLFTRNVTGPDQLAALTASLRAERPDLLIAIDHEGGEFSHLSAVSGRPMPSPRTLGDLDDPDLTRLCAREAAVTLARSGIDVMLAPSADVNNDPANPIISTRSFGTTPSRVARHVRAFVAGVHDAGIAACAKHFPGHGDVTVDSHLALPYVDRWAEEVARIELPPFVAAIEAGVDLVMSAHIVFSDFDTVPATLSHRLLTGLLRDELGFRGVITTDALEMRGITAGRSIPDAVVASVAAGADLAMVAVADADPEALSAALVDAVGNGSLSEQRLSDAASRVRRLGAALTTTRTSSVGDEQGSGTSGASSVGHEQGSGVTSGTSSGGDEQGSVVTGGISSVGHEQGSVVTSGTSSVGHEQGSVVTSGTSSVGDEQGSGVAEVARRVLASQVVPALGPAAYVVDLAQPVHPAWRPYFEGLPELFGGDGVVIRSDDPAAVGGVLLAAAGRPLVIAIQDAVRTPWMRAALDKLLAGHQEAVVALCTGLPEDRALVPGDVAVVVTGGRNLVVLRAIADKLTG